jgi:spore germination cell wall hydrolase CwlJ-like protein
MEMQMSDKLGFFDPYFRSNGPFSFFGRDMSLDPKPEPEPDPNSLLVPVTDQVSEPAAGDAPQLSDDDVNALGRLIFAEGADHDQVPEAMEGIGWAVRNRVGKAAFPGTLQGVITQTDKNGVRQFDGFGNKLWNQAADPSTLEPANAAAYQHAQEVARGILSGQIPDPTGGAQYFYSSDNGDPPAGFFSKAMEHGRLFRSIDPIGKFTFLRDTQSP